MSGNQQPQGQQNPLSGFGFNTTTTTPNPNQSAGFGAFASSPSAFGNIGQNTASTDTSQKVPLFGGGGFGQTPGQGAQQPSASGTGGSIFGSSSGSSFLASNATPAGGQNSNAFGSNAAPSSGSLFGGGANTNTNNSSNPLLGGAMKQPSTPATQTNPLFGSSTTPAAPPPSGSLFGSQPNNQAGVSSSSPSTGGLFGNQSTLAPSGGLFGGTNTTGSSTNAPVTSLGIFGAASNSSLGQTTNPPAGSATTALPNPSNPLFGNASSSSSANVSQPSPFSAFGAKPSTPSAQGDINTSAPAGGTPALPPVFGSSNAATAVKDPTPTGNGSSSTPSPALPSLFSNLPKKPVSTPTSNGSSAFSGFASLAAPKDSSKEAGKDDKSVAPALGSLFSRPSGATDASKDQPKDGSVGKDAVSGATASPFTAFSLGANKDANTSKPSETSGAATSGPTPAIPTTAPSAGTSVPAPSMLRGKTVEDIVNRWTSDLETHTREFSQFASEVAVWDRTLIENGNYISALYATVLSAESTQASLDQSLDHVEQQQRHLTATLDQYEKSASEILHGPGGIMSSTEGLGLADSERDKSYALAANLYTQLDDLSRSLTQMVETVNSLNLSPGPSQSSGTADDGSQEDAISTIAGILNAHLSSLQWIDGSLKDMEGKVKDAERKIKDTGARGGRTSTDEGNSRSRGYGLGSSRG